MFKLNMTALRKAANCEVRIPANAANPANAARNCEVLIPANPANAANFFRESAGEPRQLAGLAELAGLPDAKTHFRGSVHDSVKLAGLAELAGSRNRKNDPAQAEPARPVLATPDPNAWRVLSAAYHAHHFTCHVCIAAGRGDGYGLRCGAGAALWVAYQDAP